MCIFSSGERKNDLFKTEVNEQLEEIHQNDDLRVPVTSRCWILAD